MVRKFIYMLLLLFILIQLPCDIWAISMESSGKLINVPYINQNNIASGCEAVSATMLLRYHGYNLSENDFANKYLIRKNWNVDNRGRIHGPAPDSAYSGNPYVRSGRNCGYGIYAPALAKSVEKVLDKSKHKVNYHTGISLDEVINNYINNDVPVLIWATIGMIPSGKGDSWIINYIDNNSKYKIGDLFTWKKNEHCLVLVGYNGDKYCFNDPYKNRGLVWYDKSLVKKRFTELGGQCLSILKQ